MHKYINMYGEGHPGRWLILDPLTSQQPAGNRTSHYMLFLYALHISAHTKYFWWTFGDRPAPWPYLGFSGRFVDPTWQSSRSVAAVPVAVVFVCSSQWTVLAVCIPIDISDTSRVRDHPYSTIEITPGTSWSETTRQGHPSLITSHRQQLADE